MNYLLINHVPFGQGSAPNRFLVGDMWLEDLRAQAKAWSSYGRLGVAVPCLEHLPPEHSGSFNLVEINIDEEEFELFPLPQYLSWQMFFKSLGDLQHRLNQYCQWASIIQADYGGHPVPLGQVAWSIAEKHAAKRIWVFDGADPFPRMERAIAEESNRLKQIAKRVLTARFEKFCFKAIDAADLVFTHNVSVMKRFKEVWNQHCYSFDRSFVKQQMLINEQQAEVRKARLMDQSQPLRLVTASRQIAIKATDHILKAMSAAIDRGTKLELEVLGDGDELPHYKQMAHDLGIADKVRFTGAVPYGEPLFERLEQAHVMVVTNLTAEISRNVLLGMALGLPLILYRNPGTDMLIEQSDTGMLVPCGDIAALSDALVEAEQNRSRLAEVLTNGLKLAQVQTMEAVHARRAELAAACLSADLAATKP
ncbi:MAG: glycosyltransferase [Cyanobacteria bacterium CRU_2_1]|nr:glycosyltransferase [Cyanobacteria bacterium RU_5_0]NJR62487.1 glycosyltransferase [Cyanobacteria bacterium CRU_2_1]